MTDRSARRMAAEARGRRAERFAAIWLRAKGYTILARRVRLPVGEIDLIARRGRIVAFVEVKARKALTDAEQAVPAGAWRRINRAAESWMASRRQLSTLDWRFDLIAVVPGRLPVHFRDTWRPNSAAWRG